MKENALNNVTVGPINQGTLLRDLTSEEWAQVFSSPKVKQFILDLVKSNPEFNIEDYNDENDQSSLILLFLNRIARVEEELKILNSRFEDMSKRFEALQRQITNSFEAIDKQLTP